ncbi:hypothetical protein T11_8060 [Trichinella zimbabwensis]|uniref:Uncharacterized protein n=1 Tax=Trichinella zimbabwensis TaxID=268475 RepID=A0A0V1H514_9BILA|nr:hypothetical protein T11_8060 [Trichinella zimbabwensis]
MVIFGASLQQMRCDSWTENTIKPHATINWKTFIASPYVGFVVHQHSSRRCDVDDLPRFRRFSNLATRMTICLCKHVRCDWWNDHEKVTSVSCLLESQSDIQRHCCYPVVS